MPGSNSLLSNRNFNKLVVNRLDALKIRSNNIASQTPSYLFSAVFNNGNFNRNLTGGTLTFVKSNVDSIIQFSDRPFRQTKYITFEQFVSLFTNVNGSNTFEEDPPNGVLVHSEEQQTYEITLIDESYESGNEYSKFNLKLLPGENHGLNTVTGRMNFFVDNNSIPPKVKITDSDGEVRGSL